ncbi:MAG: hypothetical protein ACLP6G_02885 [Terriglobales bacterium]
MPVTYSIDAPARTIRTTCRGPVKLAEVLDHFRTLQDDPACTGQLDVLLNLSDVESLPQTTQLTNVTAAVSLVRAKVEFRFCAIVANRDAMFGMMRIFEVFAGRYFRAIQVFRGETEAEAWLAGERAGQDT